eukprot:gene5944-7147_t
MARPAATPTQLMLPPSMRPPLELPDAGLKEKEPAPPGVGDEEEEKAEENEEAKGCKPYIPEDVRPLLEKVVQFVAKNGPEFEAKVRQRERNNPKLAFLLPWNPLYSYYRARLEAAGGAKITEMGSGANSAVAFELVLGDAVIAAEAKKTAQQADEITCRIERPPPTPNVIIRANPRLALKKPPAPEPEPEPEPPQAPSSSSRFSEEQAAPPSSKDTEDTTMATSSPSIDFDDSDAGSTPAGIPIVIRAAEAEPISVSPIRRESSEPEILCKPEDVKVNDAMAEQPPRETEQIVQLLPTGSEEGELLSEDDNNLDETTSGFATGTSEAPVPTSDEVAGEDTTAPPAVEETGTGQKDAPDEAGVISETLLTAKRRREVGRKDSPTSPVQSSGARESTAVKEEQVQASEACTVEECKPVANLTAEERRLERLRRTKTCVATL